MNIFVVRNRGQKPQILVSHMVDQEFRDYLLAGNGDEEIGSMVSVENHVAEGLLALACIDEFSDQLEELLTAIYQLDR